MLYYKKNICCLIYVIALAWLFLVDSLLAQKTDSDSIQFDINYFYDSAHHWYDIREEKRIIDPIENQKRYDITDITRIADNIVLFQKVNGGWAKNYDMLAILTDDQKAAVEKSKNETNTTFDNGTTFSQVDYLAKVYTITGEKKYMDACVAGLSFILKAQYDNGGWSQFYPDTNGYRKYITFNDGAMMGIMNTLFKIVNKESHFLFLDENLYEQVGVAFNKGIECILKCQIYDKGILTAWCQQHDNIDFTPQNARTFEPAGICNGESSEIVELLMALENPDEKIIAAVQGAVDWFIQSQIYGLRVIDVKAPKTEFIYHTSSNDKEVLQDSEAPPIWTRFYELGTHRPMFCKRSGEIVYSLAEVERERRTGYAWYIYNPQQVIDKYPDWQKKWVPDNNVLEN